MKIYFLLIISPILSEETVAPTICQSKLLESYDFEGTANTVTDTNHMCTLNGDNCCTAHT